MELILWRHADAEPAHGESDLARKLTGKGRKQAVQMAHWLERRLPDGARIMASPAVRAMETAEALARLSGRKVTVMPEIGPGADPVRLLIAAGWPENRHPVVLVAHQPSLGQLVSFMLWGEARDMTFRKGAVWWLSNRRRAPSRADSEAVSVPAVTLRAVACPDLL
jgi:phosphohistidine phosphatase